MWTELRTRAMGTDVVIVGPAGEDRHLEEAADRIHDLERRWSRFLPDSELAMVNAHPERPVIVSPETFEVIAMAVDAWRTTAGRFDPTVLASLLELGYDRSFHEMSGTVAARGRAVPSPTPIGVALDAALHAVRVPAGVTIDLGGIGKGAAADLVVAERRTAGVAAIGVNIGGDARVSGPGPADGRWRVALRCPGSDETRAIDLIDGAACTSSTLGRRWTNQRGPAHHLIDPFSGASAATGVVSVGVVAAAAAQAEILAKTALLGGLDEALELLADCGVEGSVVTEGGSVHDVGRSLVNADSDGSPLNPVLSADGTHRD